jgi:hypothetical protein
MSKIDKVDKAIEFALKNYDSGRLGSVNAGLVALTQAIVYLADTIEKALEKKGG